MTNKNITPVTFSDESVEKNEQVGVKSVDRLAPGTGSSSGSGSGGSTLGIDSGEILITSRYGCSWNVRCEFFWNASWGPGFANITFYFPRIELRVTGDTVGKYTANGFSDIIYDRLHTITYTGDGFDVFMEYDYLLRLTVFEEKTGSGESPVAVDLGETYKLNSITIHYKISGSSILFDSCEIGLTPQN